MRQWLWTWSRERTYIERRIRDDKSEEEQRDHHCGDEKRPFTDVEVVAEVAGEGGHVLSCARILESSWRVRILLGTLLANSFP